MLSSAIPKANKTTLCASEEIPSDYLLAVAPHNTNSMIILYPFLPFIIIWSQCPHCEPTKRPTQSVFRPFNTGKSQDWSKVDAKKILEWSE